MIIKVSPFGSHKAVSLLGMRRLKAYLYDLQQGVLEQSEKMERIRRGYVWFWVVIFLLLCASLVFGILAAIK